MEPENFVVRHKGKIVYRLNYPLAQRQQCEENMEEIVKVHEQKMDIFELILSETSKETLRNYATQLTEIEFELQKLWKFDQNEKMHRFWLTPKCECPKLDNEDNYPTGYYYRSAGCPLHGN